MLIDVNPHLFWPDEHINLTRLRRDLHTGYHDTRKILEKEEIRVRRLPYGTRYRYYVTCEDARRLTRVHGSEHARRRRLARSAARATAPPLVVSCRHCGMRGHQWRNGLNTAGNREVKCGYCKRCYTLGKRPALRSRCVHCGSFTRQWRQQLTSAGNLTIRCGHCRRHYTVPGNPDALVTAKPELAGWVRLRLRELDRCEW